jgi:hypothetical protein
VVIGNLDLVGISGLPSEANAVLLIDSDAVTSASFPAESLKSISRGDSQFEKISHAVYLIELPPGYPPDFTWADTPACRRIDSIKNVL